MLERPSGPACSVPCRDFSHFSRACSGPARPDPTPSCHCRSTVEGSLRRRKRSRPAQRDDAGATRVDRLPRRGAALARAVRSRSTARKSAERNGLVLLVWLTRKRVRFRFSDFGGGRIVRPVGPGQADVERGDAGLARSRSDLGEGRAARHSQDRRHGKTGSNAGMTVPDA